jgi:hypothetical protein
MSDDIVERLRLTPVLIRADEMGQSRIDYEACKKFVNQEGVKLMREAANEIERLRAERDEARREVCEWVALQTKRTSREVEQGRGWDCFDGDGWSDPGDECQREAL